jgi:murein L,D-transpeptidase YafK
MKYFLFITIFIYPLFSNSSFVDIYREKGINAVEKLINESLRTKYYWDNYLKNKNITNGYYESIDNILVCSKNMQNISIYDAKLNNKLLYTSNVITGKKNGNKQKEGDLKTPLGAYKLTRSLTKIDPFYGAMALVTSYPNNFDKSKNRTGHGIWIHGVPVDKKRDPYTKGCIALENDNLRELYKKINMKKSILIIKDTDTKVIKKDDISTILSQLFSWKEAWKKSNFKEYISFYSKEFKKTNGTGINQFKRYKKRVFSKNEKKTIIFSKINIIPYPNDLGKNIFKITLFEKYSTKSYKFIGNKELYLELTNNKIQILFEG